MRVYPLRRLPALTSLPGHTQAHEAKCWALGNDAISSPTSVSSASAVRRATPGIVHS